MMKEAEIRPAALFERYLELSRRDIETFFSDHTGFADVACPACGDSAGSLAFVKLGFDYRTCDGCASLYLSPRPSIEMQSDYARNSEAVEFWSTHFYRETAEARRERMFKPRAQQVRKLVEDGLAAAGVIADIGAGYGIFLEELKALGGFERIVAVEPAPGLADVCRQKGFPVIEKFVEDVEDGEIGSDLTTAFEVIEHVFEPVDFLTACRNTLKPGGMLLFTTLTITGFDLQVLWSASNSIYPPHHINLLSIDGLKSLVERSGLELVQISTPGRLDVDIVSNAIQSMPGLEVDRFARTLASMPSEVREDFQAFLQRANLSSHVRVLARRPL
jgi:SAM-dependent methyltransferase